MIRLCFLGALLAYCGFLSAPARAAVTDYTDTWWTPSEPGWGVNLAHQRNAIFATFYVYGADGRPGWYSGLLLRDGPGERFAGPLNRTTGTWFGAPVWQGYTLAVAGTATFTATSSTTGTLVYSVDGVAVQKTIERITLAPLSVAGTYIGGVSGRRSGCSPSGAIISPIQLEVLHSTLTGELRIDQISTASGQLVCRMEGRAVQTGKVLTVANATYSCSDNFGGPTRIFNLQPTPAGFEAQWFTDGGNGCVENGQLSGVTQNP